MESQRDRDFERGMQLVAKLPEVMTPPAGDPLEALYRDLQETLRVPFVNFIFRTLANYPEAFGASWSRLAPTFRTRAFERAADRLRAMAPLEPPAEAAGIDWDAHGAGPSVRAFTDSIHYVLPKLLLVAVAFDESLSGRLAWSSSEPAPSDALPRGVAEGTRALELVDPKGAPAAVGELFGAIARVHGHPGVASYYRALGGWPTLLATLWRRIEPIVGSPAYEARKERLVEAANEEVYALAVASPGGGRPGAGGDAEDVRCILEVFRTRLIPDLLLDVALVKAMLDGPEAARRSRFSAA